MRAISRDLPSKRRLAALFACALSVIGPTPAIGQYRIQPGDTVRLAVPSVQELASEVMVDVDGTLRLPGIGEVSALGLTLAELQAEAGRLIEAQPHRRFGADGEPIFIQLSGEDIQVDIATYRPVFISGDVRSPGPITYRPGLTVRAAIASAGGAQRGVADVDRPNPQDEVRLLGERAIRANEIAEFSFAEWRLEAELAADPDPPLPDRAGIPVSDARLQEVLTTHQRSLDSALKELVEKRLFLYRTATQSDERLTILQKQAETQRTAAAFDEEELDRLSSLFDRGIVPINRLSEIRRAQLASATRLLQTEDSVARVTLERTTIAYETQVLESARSSQILKELRDVRQKLATARAGYASVSEQIATLNGWLSPHFDLAAVIFRADGGDSERAAMETLLQPGDVLNVSILLAIGTVLEPGPRGIAPAGGTPDGRQVGPARE